MAKVPGLQAWHRFSPTSKRGARPESQAPGRLAALLVAMPLAAMSAEPPPSAASGVSAPAQAASSAANAAELLGWLHRIHDAATHVNYIGTLVNWAGTTVSSARVAHFADARGEVERVDALDGEARGTLRMNDEVRTVWPHAKLTVVEPKDPRAAFPSLVTGGEQRIPEFYELRPLGLQRVAGRDADRLLLKARDTVRFDQLVWADRATGLLLRVDVQADGRTLESSAFSEVSVAVRPQPDLVVGEWRRSEAFRRVKASAERTKLDAEGWQLKNALPPGFTVLGCVRRTMPGASPGTVDAGASGAGAVLQAIFTDGLTHVSVFIEPFQKARHTSAGLTVIGATHTLMRRSNDDWLTAVGDVPPTTLEQFLLALERKH